MAGVYEPVWSPLCRHATTRWRTTLGNKPAAGIPHLRQSGVHRQRDGRGHQRLRLRPGGRSDRRDDEPGVQAGRLPAGMGAHEGGEAATIAATVLSQAVAVAAPRARHPSPCPPRLYIGNPPRAPPTRRLPHARRRLRGVAHSPGGVWLKWVAAVARTLPEPPGACGIILRLDEFTSACTCETFRRENARHGRHPQATRPRVPAAGRLWRHAAPEVASERSTSCSARPPSQSPALPALTAADA